MKIIDRIIARAAKITGSDKTRRQVEALIMQAYEAGRKDAVRDIVITLEDDMVNDDHAPAIELINANC